MAKMTSWTRSDVAWVGGQVVLLIAAFVVVPALDGGPGRMTIPWSRSVGWALMLAGPVLGVLAAIALGRNLVPQPSPIQGSTMVATGPYGVVRHPIYTGVLIAAIGSLVRTPSLTGLALTAVLFVFFDRKAAHEERLLLEAHPEYADYMARVPGRLVPGIG